MTEKYILQTRRWIANFVIGFDLCPFASKPFKEDKIHYRVYEGTDLEELAIALTEELLRITNEPATKVETSLVIHPNILQDFHDYNDFLEAVDSILVKMNLMGVIQVATFHPDYQFADTQLHDLENYTNRSPYPMLHLLREASVELAVEHYEDVAEIPSRNIAKMKELGLDEIRRLSGIGKG